MKKVLIGLTAALIAGTGVSTTATAQVRDRDRDGVPNKYDKHPNKPRWAKGQRLDSRYRQRTYVITDYSRRGWRAPPPGYAYYRTDTGDVVLAAVATGIISAVIASAIYN
jgi:Ni/Co efflux regulator RcnB